MDGRVGTSAGANETWAHRLVWFSLVGQVTEKNFGFDKGAILSIDEKQGQAFKPLLCGFSERSCFSRASTSPQVHLLPNITTLQPFPA